ncbi:MAG: hypothetical protein N3F64_00640 [Nitrososphaeria archaeon]|nr:hypothetical protein [Nitrososphaeria archaeon]
MPYKCSECGSRVVFDNEEYVCEKCGKIFEEIYDHQSKPFFHNFPKPFASKRSSILYIIKDVCDRLDFNSTILNDASYIAESIIESGTRFNGLEIAFFSLYSACKNLNPFFCEMVLKEFRSMGLKVNERNCMRILSRFWKYYSYKSFNLSSYLNFLLESLKSNIFVREYVRNFYQLNENILWSKIKLYCLKFLEDYRFLGESLKVKCIISIYVSCNRVFRSFGLENPVTLRLLSKHFCLDFNNLRKVLDKVTVFSYEGLAKV